MTDLRMLRPAGSGPACVVYLQQRFMGLPVYDGRRAVIFRGRRTEVTGWTIPVRSLPARIPAQDAGAAVRSAFRETFGRRCRGLERLAAFASAERCEFFRHEALSGASAHLSVFAARRARLAWVVEIALPGGPRLEHVLDAQTLALLRRRELTQAAAVSLSLRPGAGSLQMFFDPAWRSSGSVALEFKNKPWDPPDPVQGLIRGTDTRGIHSLNAFTLANRALDVLAPFLPAAVPRARMLVFTAEVSSDSEAARCDGRDVKLKGFRAGPTRFAVFDPCVVIHEVGHAVMNTTVGGSAFERPFESDGESAAVSEGLADFLGLTIWNGICRSIPGAPAEEEVFGSFLLAKPRDYSEYFAGDGPARKQPPPADPHEDGKFLCGALLQARAALIDEKGLHEDAADEALWKALGTGLALLPHAERLPNHCCVRRVVLDRLAPSLQALVSEAFEDVGLGRACPHFQ